MTTRWVQKFMSLFEIVMRAQCGTFQESPACSGGEVAFFGGLVARDFVTGSLSESEVESSDETHIFKCGQEKRPCVLW